MRHRMSERGDAPRSCAYASAATGAAVQDVATALEARDRSDRTRATSPLTRAERCRPHRHDGMSIDEVIERVLSLVDERRARERPACPQQVDVDQSDRDQSRSRSL